MYGSARFIPSIIWVMCPLLGVNDCHDAAEAEECLDGGVPGGAGTQLRVSN
jgi:hypothetical protein